MYTHGVRNRQAELEACFKALGDGNRLRILNLLLHGELCGCDIQYVLEMTQSNVSRHLAYLKHSGLVTDRREGFRVFHGLADPANGELKPLFEFLRAVFREDDNFRNDLARLKQAIKDGSCQMEQIIALPGPASRKPAPGRNAGRSLRRSRFG